MRNILYTMSDAHEDKFLGAETSKLPQYCLHLPPCKRPLHQDLMECRNSSSISRSHVPSAFASNRVMTTGCTERKRAMNVYYMRVLTRRGVAIFEDPSGELQPPPKRISIAKLTFPERIPPKVTLTDDTQHVLTNSEVQEEWEQAESAAEPLAQGARPSAKSRPWLEDLERGFRCMGCCRVFRTLEILLKHVECGVEEGFSCLTFHLAFARLRRKYKKERKEIVKDGEWPY
ncbi:protein FAM170A [Fukomys damarensis]|nr:protein FAM170A [Fukomys damarensis]